MILVFKTNVKTRKMIRELKPVLDKILCKWNFDLADCDRILRVDSDENISPDIIRVLKMNGLECEELE